MPFPTPVGGASLPEDFAPSVLFAVLYGCLVPVMLWRMVQRRSWNLLTIGCAVFAIERIVVFSLRASQAHSDSLRQREGLLTYMQITFAVGFISIPQDLARLLRCVLINATFGTDTVNQAPAVCGARRSESAPKSELSSSSKWRLLNSSPATFDEILQTQPIHEVLKEGAPYVEDLPRERFWARRFVDLVSLAFLAAIIPGTIGNARFGKLLDNQSASNQVMSLRYASSAVALALIISMIFVVLWGSVRLERISQPAIKLMLTILLCLCSVAIYRLSVMHNHTESLESMAPGALNSPSSKALFYVFHLLPEWLAILLLFAYNTRELCGTGPFGDYRDHDETEKERAKREKKEAEKRQKQELVTES